MAGSEIVVSVLKYDGLEHRRWPARVAKVDWPLLVLDAVFEDEIEHDLLGTISSGTISTEYYWLDRWYNVFRFETPSGSLRNYYCNINLPPKFGDGVLDYVDLDIDLLVWPDGRREVLDREDFESSAARFGYSDELRKRVEQTLEELIGLAEEGEFPFEAG